MTVAAAPPALVDGQEMSWEEYVALGVEARAEYVDGKVLVSPRPSKIHQQLGFQLAKALEAVLPEDLEVTLDWSWKVGGDEFAPDVMVHQANDETVRLTSAPVLAVEILSSNRSADLVMKAVKYAAAGLPHYWVIDPRDGVLDAFDLVDGVYAASAHVTMDQPAEISFGPASLHVDLTALTARRRPRG